MPIGSSSGDYYPDESALLVDQNKMPASQPIDESRPKVYITKPDVEDRSNYGLVGSLTAGMDYNAIGQKLLDLKKYGLGMSGIDRGNAINVDENQVEETPLSKELGSSSIRMPPGGPTEPAGALKPEEGTQTPGKGSQQESRLKIGDKTPEGETVRHTTSSPLINITDEDINRGIEIGLSAGPGTMAGVRSKSMSAGRLSIAQGMEHQGVHPDEIWEKTGWFRAADGRMKYEIPDTGSNVKPEKLKVTKISQQKLDAGGDLREANFSIPRESTTQGKITVGDILHHPKLYEAYPDLKDIKVVPLGFMDALSGTRGWHNAAKNTIGLGVSTLEEMRSTLLHELQHAIQTREGFAQGAAPEMFHSTRWRDLSKEFKAFKEETEKDIRTFFGGDLTKVYEMKKAIANEPAIRSYFQGVQEGRKPSSWESTWTKKDMMEGAQNIIDAKEMGVYDDVKKILRGEGISGEYGSLAHGKYESVKGEVESRNVQRRMKYEEEMRQAAPPYRTESHPWEEQINSPLDITNLSK